MYLEYGMETSYIHEVLEILTLDWNKEMSDKPKDTYKK